MLSNYDMTTLQRVLLLEDLNTRVVLAGTALIGFACGLIGSFALLRRRALVGDALAHGTLPGLCAAFLLLGQKDLAPLLIGALVSCTLAVGIITLLGRARRVNEDAIIGVVLSFFFGAGVCLSRIAQNVASGNQAGLDSFIFGKAAAMLTEDVYVIGICCLVVILVVSLLFKEFVLVSFDSGFASATGWPVKRIDFALMSAVVVTTVAGLQAVGVVLIIGLLVIPPAIARLWSNRVRTVVIISCLTGAGCAVVGTVWSALTPQLPTGPIIVLVATSVFAISLLCAPLGMGVELVKHYKLRNKIDMQNVLRALCELSSSDSPITLEKLERARPGQKRGLQNGISRAVSEGLVRKSGEKLSLTDKGETKAKQVTRNYRLWELYLTTYADVATSHVDASADSIEHVLSDEIVRELEELLRARQGNLEACDV